MDDKRIEPIYMLLEKWNSICEDKSILVRYVPDEEKLWDVHTLNKIKVVFASYDKEYTTKANVQQYDLYEYIPTHSIVRIPKNTNILAGKAGDYRKIITNQIKP